MSRKHDRAAALALADNCLRLACDVRVLNITSSSGHTRASTLTVVFDRARDLTDSICALDQARDILIGSAADGVVFRSTRYRIRTLIRTRSRTRRRALNLANDLADDFERLGVELVRRYQGAEVGDTCETRAEDYALTWLARLLPAGERSRFVAEERGNLGDCEHWRHRAAWLIGLATGTPRLAWMMRRESQRSRA